MPEFRIHGDNIVECERTLDLIIRALGVVADKLPHPVGSPITPTYVFPSGRGADAYRFTFLPGFGRWDVDILDILRTRGGCLREAVDAVICRVESGGEVPLLAIEYCGALPAGNQAWQRNGRALSFARAGLFYVYVAELSGYELDANRKRKAARLPNPAVPFSYLALTEATGSAAIPVFVRSPGASDDAVRTHTPFYGENELLEIFRCVIMGKRPTGARKKLEAKVLGLVKQLARTRHREDTLSPERWGEAFEAATTGEGLPNYLVRTPRIIWSKTAYIAGLTATTRALMAATAEFAYGLTSGSLPLCLIAEKDRKRLALDLRRIYPKISRTFLDWCRGSGPLAICWVMGFKPRGDDARPDRGLPPLCRMLIGDATDMLTIVYGPASAATWPKLAGAPLELMNQNGLWESVLACSDAVLVDAKTLAKPPPVVYVSTHWAATKQASAVSRFAVTPVPLRIGENDVDTALHILFARLGGPDVFEGMCNPPGGDWSGMSLQTTDRRIEHRWLGLPRVTAKGAKRPDHVFQLFQGFTPYLVLAVESKERANSVEPGIGPRLSKYVRDLVQRVPSVHRSPSKVWRHYTKAVAPLVPPVATAAAFVAVSSQELATVASKADVDLVIGLQYSTVDDSSTFLIHPCTPVGRKLARLLVALSVGNLRLSIILQS